jgi:phycoerythrin beta chain
MKAAAVAFATNTASQRKMGVTEQSGACDSIASEVGGYFDAVTSAIS